jgi:hypothetical protein
MVNDVGQDDEVEGCGFPAGHILDGLLAECHGRGSATEKASNIWANINGGHGSSRIDPRDPLCHGTFATANLQYFLRLGYPCAHERSKFVKIDKNPAVALRYATLIGTEQSPDQRAGGHDRLTLLRFVFTTVADRTAPHVGINFVQFESFSALTNFITRTGLVL